jgi:hypothetical protein
MIRRQPICSSISRLALSLLLLLLCGTEAGAQRFLKLEKDSIPLFRGFAVSFDMAGALQMQLSDYGQYEGALRLNLHDQYFPTFELGLGHANHEKDVITEISYKTTAPYFRIGADVNIMNKKHTGNRVFVGIRYAFTSYKVDISHPVMEDPIWKWDTTYEITGESCNMHWGEVLFGLDAKIFGPLHLGWSGRYRIRFSHKDGVMGKTWYVPGYGLQDSSTLGYTFCISFDI